MVLGNLVDNALKYSLDDRLDVRVDVRATTVPGQVAIDVRDQGIGWARGNERRMFRRFVRLGDELTITGSSPGVGQGATFTVVLPGRLDGQDPDRRG